MTDCLKITADNIATAAGVLTNGGLVAFPTETVYGLGANACDGDAVAAIFVAKQRPSFNPLISHVATSDMAFDLGRKTPIAAALAAAFWPGPLTLILHRTDNCPLARLTSAGLDKIAIRVPSHAGARELLTTFGGAIAAPSANPSGRLSPSRAEHVMALMDGQIDMVLDGGPCESGLESTIVDCTGEEAVLLRPGGVTRAALSAALSSAGLDGTIIHSAPLSDGEAPISPGQLSSHYAPKNALRLNAQSRHDNEIFIGFGPDCPASEDGYNLSSSGNLREAAARLFDILHDADNTGGDRGIAIAPIPIEGLGEAINDRLHRAAAPR
ncbi:L-threonylcarbamoyladenylate synthase [Alphaproteobacteria bacterium]|nr:L-threonylcarbamoyladenylate synthase [Alphaproteobacteria bacterium]